MHSKKEKIDILLVALSTPILVGVYKEGKLIEKIQSKERSSDALPMIYKDLLKRYKIDSFIYANGPGSFMSIKVAYIFLRSLGILKDIPLYALDAFHFNNNRPIKAVGKLHFVKIQDKIETKKFDEVQESSFELPQTLDVTKLSSKSAPMYAIGAV
ncbi:TsaB protein, required for threonylcarbamoyladenosine (t(6)A) formation in tRNA [hydrothermal vent metagenome]|uniref:TsaB protein, required for threonylcarbamoyladenosine (T(6)A) formation in tRNA n=1 Tax=hydrothermal vent metagenome TaxID=652676 RepID=A0A1W1BAC0_9ZZZZ